MIISDHGLVHDSSKLVATRNTSNHRAVFSPHVTSRLAPGTDVKVFSVRERSSLLVQYFWLHLNHDHNINHIPQ
ncbi:MAG: hypothetical protein KAI83_04025 [Thiomargarita sp.]|nr:hypothetical protein [Thiomargarita sp.]